MAGGGRSSALPVQPHFANVGEPVEIECTADLDGDLWRYVLRCTPERVVHEALYRKPSTEMGSILKTTVRISVIVSCERRGNGSRRLIGFSDYCVGRVDERWLCAGMEGLDP